MAVLPDHHHHHHQQLQVQDDLRLTADPVQSPCALQVFVLNTELVLQLTLCSPDEFRSTLLRLFLQNLFVYKVFNRLMMIDRNATTDYFKDYNQYVKEKPPNRKDSNDCFEFDELNFV